MHIWVRSQRCTMAAEHLWTTIRVQLHKDASYLHVLHPPNPPQAPSPSPTGWYWHRRCSARRRPSCWPPPPQRPPAARRRPRRTRRPLRGATPRTRCRSWPPMHCRWAVPCRRFRSYCCSDVCGRRAVSCRFLMLFQPLMVVAAAAAAALKSTMKHPQPTISRDLRHSGAAGADPLAITAA